MSYVYWKVYRNEFLGTDWSGTTEELSDYFDVNLMMAAGDKKDSFSFKLVNNFSTYDTYFKPNDKITFYRVSNMDTVSSTDIKMVGILRASPFESNGKKDVVKLEGYNFSEAVMTALVFYDSITAKSPMEILKEAIASVALQAPKFSVSWNTTDNPLLYKKDGTTLFPTFKKRYLYVPLSKVIDEMLSPAGTEDGQYIWWVDNQNKFQVRSGVGGVKYDYNSETDSDTISYKDSKDLSQVRNFIILKGGTDPSGNQIQVVKQDFESISRHGLRFFYAVSKTTIAQNLNKADVGNESTTRYPDFTGGFTTTWPASYTDTVEGISVTEGSPVTIPDTVNSQQQYKMILRKEVETQLTKEAQDVINGTRFGKLKIDITVRAGSKPWVLGDRISCTIPKLGINPKELRVREIQLTSDRDTYSLEEDVGTI